MFKQNISFEVWGGENGKYRLRDNDGNPVDQTPEDTCDRVAKALADVEIPEKREYWYKEFKSILGTKFAGGGRIMANVGAGQFKKETSPLNCTVMKQIGDSIASIMDVAKDAALTLKAGCGVGYDFSTIRPKGSYVFGAGAGTSGIISFMKIFDAICSTILSGGGRRGAQMACLDIQSPEIEDFITAKRQDGVLRYFNCSVLVTDRFMKAVENNEDWDLWFWEKDRSGRRNAIPSKEICVIKQNDIPYNYPEFKYFKFAQDHCEVEYGNCTKDTIFKKRVYKTVKAKYLFDLIMNSTYNFWEPGFLIIDRVNIENNLYFSEVIRATNPCFGPETLIAVADGRHAVSIKQLAEEGKDVAVYSVDRSTGDVSIKIGRNPRITGYDQKLLRVYLDDKSYLDVTSNHKFLLLDGKEVEAKNLKIGDSLPRFSKRLEPITPKSKDKNYYQLITNVKNSDKKSFEHRMIAQFFFPEKWKELYNFAKNDGWAKTGGLVVHHKDFDKLNNSPDNLEIMTFKEHQEYHAHFNSVGKQNSHYSGFSSEEIKNHALELTKNLKRRFSTKEWEKFAKEKNIPQQFSSFRVDTLGTVTELSKLCASELGYENSELDPRILKTYQKMINMGYKNVSIKNGIVFVQKQCEQCNELFEIQSTDREIAFCSHSCSSKRNFQNQEYRNSMNNVVQTRAIEIAKKNKPLQAKIYSDLKFKLQRDPLQKEWIEECKKENVPWRTGKVLKFGFQSYDEVKKAGNEYNHKVVSVTELPGTHTVYNITVDDNHTVGIVTEAKNGKRGVYYTGVYVSNCGEIPLQNSGACLLGSMILWDYVKKPFEISTNDIFDNFDFDQYKKDVRVVSRLLDNVVEINNLPLQEMRVQIETKRRHGLGFTGLASCLNMLRIPYGSDVALVFSEKIALINAQESLLANIELAKEKGFAPIFESKENREAVLKSVYLERLINSFDENIPYLGKHSVSSDQIKKDILQYGLRYSHATAIAPTGTMSLTWGNNCSGGIEPEIADSYFRNIRVPGKKTKVQEEVMSYSYFMWRKNKGNEPLPSWWRTSKDLNVKDHLKTQAVVQKWVDNSISKTINIPSDYSFEDFKNVYMDGWKMGLKGITTYRPNASIGAGVLTQKSDLDATTYTFTLEDGKEVSFLGSDTVEYDGETHNVANLFDALKEGIYGNM